MLYRPSMPEKMWDTTLFYWKGDFHIFYLAQGTIGHVSTRDFAAYRTYPSIYGFGGPGDWNQNGLPLTGCVTEQAGRFLMLLGTIEPVSRRQVYGLYTSEDLIVWEEYPYNPVLNADGVFYDNCPSPRDGGMYTAWRDPMIYQQEAGVYSLCLCARETETAPDSTGAVVARVQTRDFIHYEYLPPLVRVGDSVKYAECPDCFVLEGNRYVLFLDHSWGGVRRHTSSRDNAAGIWYRVQPGCQGDFIRPEDDLLLGSAEDRQASWAGRTVVAGEDRLLYSHITASRPGLAPPKVIRADEKGQLYLEYYPLLDALYGPEVPAERSLVEDDAGSWREEGGRLVGSCLGWGSATVMYPAAENACLTATITCQKGVRAGFALRCVAEGEEWQGIVLWLDYEQQRVEMDQLVYRPGEGFGRACADIVNGGVVRNGDYKRMPLDYDREYRIRLLMREEFFEVYIDDVWVITKAMETAALSGGVLAVVERGEAEFAASLRELRLTVDGNTV